MSHWGKLGLAEALPVNAKEMVRSCRHQFRMWTMFVPLAPQKTSTTFVSLVRIIQITKVNTDAANTRNITLPKHKYIKTKTISIVYTTGWNYNQLSNKLNSKLKNHLRPHKHGMNESSPFSSSSSLSLMHHHWLIIMIHQSLTLGRSGSLNGGPQCLNRHTSWNKSE